ncbi:hypothetical protein SOPP22_17355 [Shewanella sp. OPT22]|nr:hypothetical protein SOPP22_17355 [Shewanella sp. OPT22]
MSGIGITSPIGQAINSYINEATNLSDEESRADLDVDNSQLVTSRPSSVPQGSAQSSITVTSSGGGHFSVGGLKYQVNRSISDHPDGDIPSFFAERKFSIKVGWGRLKEFVAERLTAIKLDNDVQFDRALKQSGLTPVRDAQKHQGSYVLGNRVGASNLDIIRSQDENFMNTKAAWNEVRKVEKGQGHKLNPEKGKVRERCPVTGDVLTTENAVKVNLPEDKGNSCFRFKGASVLMSRRGIKNALLRTETNNSTITRARLLGASFEKVTDANFVKRSPIARAWRAFWGGDTNRLDYNYMQAGGHR